tara:strand:+ start:122 stop:826 length:705 start_codon:yes stop_codon:yes gene_type:complete
MAKELPYFKFEPNQWENGNIQMLSREDKGLFIDICSIYWSRLGDLPVKLAVQKLCGGNAVALNSLCEEGIIDIKDDFICIHFLNIQLLEFEDQSNQNRDNALKGWQKRRQSKGKNAVALNPQSESDAIREDKRREDKRKEDMIDWGKLLDFYNTTFSKKNRLVNNGVKQKFLARIKEGYKKEDILKTMNNAKKDSFHDEAGYKYCTLEYFSRSATLDKYGFDSIKKNKSYIPTK